MATLKRQQRDNILIVYKQTHAFFDIRFSGKSIVYTSLIDNHLQYS
jgi:hypothetical protein